MRRARSRRKLGFSEVEGAIKIRARFLRAIEDEEWDALPGGSYPRSFIRTYANYLGLDGERLAAEHEAEPRRSRPARTEPDQAAVAGRGRRPRLSRGAVTAIVVVGLVALAVVVGIATGGGEGGPAPVTEGGPSAVSSPPASIGRQGGGVALHLATKGEVWVCVLDARGRPLVDGQVLAGGVEEGPFHSGSFTVAFGNGEVAMQVDGKETQIPASASPLGYAIDSGGRMKPLGESQRPTCL